MTPQQHWAWRVYQTGSQGRVNLLQSEETEPGPTMICPGSPWRGQSWSLLRVRLKIISTHTESFPKQAAGEPEASSPSPCPWGAPSVWGEADV